MKSYPGNPEHLQYSDSAKMSEFYEVSRKPAVIICSTIVVLAIFLVLFVAIYAFSTS